MSNDFAGLDLREVEQIVDQFCHRISGLANEGHLLDLLGWEGAIHPI